MNYFNIIPKISETTKDKIETYKSICNTRKLFELGCRECVLYKYKECPKAKEDEPSCGYLVRTDNQGTNKGKSFDGYICHTKIDIPELKYIYK